MIPVNASIWQTETWQQQMRHLIRDPQELMRRLELKSEAEPELAAALKQFPLRVPEAFVAKMAKGNWQDPLLLQVLPQSQEALPQPGYSDDPLEEKTANPVPGLIHKYPSRVLLITSPACAINCRYCFRRSFPYQDNIPGQQDWQHAIDYIAQRPDVSEVILSGGDPLVANDRALQQLIERLAQIPQLTTLRLHTRLPLVMPARITPELVDILTATRLQTVMVVHCNHANELDDATASAFRLLTRNGVSLLNQSVLLANINDNAAALGSLMRKLFGQNVLPYYIHLLDKVTGAAHFEVSEARGIELLTALRASLPGYLVPRLVREEPGKTSKTPIAL